MRMRLFIVSAVLAASPAAVAQDKRPSVEAVVHSGGICWDPDIEFPVPCDDDGD
jgi:hypothetical protein